MMPNHLLSELNLPEHIKNTLHAASVRRNSLTEEERNLLGKPGYTPPTPSVLIDAIIAFHMGKNILLKGPTGCGKTRLAETLSFLFAQPMHGINCSTDLDIEAMLGFKTLVKAGNDTAIEFVQGPVVKAMTQGHMLYIDEVNMARPETLPILNGVLDYRRSVANPFTGDTVRAKEDFRAIAAINVGYIGTVPLNEALKNRFVVIEVPYLQGNGLRKLLHESSTLTDESLLGRFVSFSADLVAQVKLGQLSDEAASIRALIDACDLASYIPPLRAVSRCISGKLEDEREQNTVINIAETWFA